MYSFDWRGGCWSREAPRSERTPADEFFEVSGSFELAVLPDAHEAVSPLLYGVSGSHFGGIAKWCQDHVLRTCPICSRAMMLIAALRDPELPLGDGEWYIMICADCRTACLVAQTT
jgi:hypothetical protein